MGRLFIEVLPEEEGKFACKKCLTDKTASHLATIVHLASAEDLLSRVGNIQQQQTAKISALTFKNSSSTFSLPQRACFPSLHSPSTHCSSHFTKMCWVAVILNFHFSILFCRVSTLDTVPPISSPPPSTSPSAKYKNVK